MKQKKDRRWGFIFYIVVGAFGLLHMLFITFQQASALQTNAKPAQSTADWHTVPAVIEVITKVQNMDTCYGIGTNKLTCDIAYVNPSVREYANVDVQYARPENAIAMLFKEWEGDGGRFMFWSGNNSVRTNGGTYSFATNGNASANGITVDALLSSYSIYAFDANELSILGIDFLQDDFESGYFSGAQGGKVAAWSWEESASSVTTGTVKAYWIVSGPAPDPPPPTDNFTDHDPNGLCAFPITGTTTITDSGGITSTQVITTGVYTRPANLLANYSFESGVIKPDGWRTVLGDGYEYEGNYHPYWTLGSGYERSGSRAVNTFENWKLVQTLGISKSLLLSFGGYYVCSSPSCNGELLLTFGASGLVANSAVVTQFTPISKVISYNPSQASNTIGFSFVPVNDVGTTFVDDAFLLPTDGLGNLQCEGNQDLYPPPTVTETNGLDGDDTTTCVIYPNGTCLPVPEGEAGSTCYRCQQPPALDPAYWIAWLGCVIRNLFSCSLRIWLLQIGNYSSAWISWIPAQAQNGIYWIAEQVVPAIALGGTTIVESGTNVWDFLISLVSLLTALVNGAVQIASLLISLFSALIRSVSDVIVLFFNLLASLFDALRSALAVEPYTIVIEGQESYNVGDLEADGRNTSKVVFAFLMGLALADSYVADGTFTPLLNLALGAMGIGTIYWMVKFWQSADNI